MKDLIFEALVTEAQFRVARHMTKGELLESAIRIVSEEMALEATEVKELETRAKKSPKPQVVEDEVEVDLDAAMDDMGSEESSADGIPDNSIQFATSEELDAALGVLMYKGIPWMSKTDTYINFADASFVTKAHEALKRRWDFVNNDERTVAIIEFDNLDDYAKVIDFIASKRMMVVKGTNDELVDDMDQALAETEAAYKKAKRDAKESGLPAPEAPSQSMSYSAVHKDAILDPGALDVLYDQTARCLRVVKRWK
jgi:hypothetical protein